MSNAMLIAMSVPAQGSRYLTDLKATFVSAISSAETNLSCSIAHAAGALSGGTPRTSLSCKVQRFVLRTARPLAREHRHDSSTKETYFDERNRSGSIECLRISSKNARRFLRESRAARVTLPSHSISRCSMKLRSNC